MRHTSTHNALKSKLTATSAVRSRTLSTLPYSKHSHTRVAMGSEFMHSLDPRECESADGYATGGYHPVQMGDTFHKGRYCVVHKLGHGSYSTVYLARGLNTHYVALKIEKARKPEKNLAEQSAVLGRIASAPGSGVADCLLSNVQDRFTHKGPNGIHTCLVFEPAGSSIRDLMGEAQVILPFNVASSLAAQLVAAVGRLHSLGIVHGDLHIGNILLQLDAPDQFHAYSPEDLYKRYGEPVVSHITNEDGEPLPASKHSGMPMQVYGAMGLSKSARSLKLADAKLFLTDFGLSFIPDQHGCHLGSSARGAVQPPEARFEPNAPLSYASDIWALGHAMWQLFTACNYFRQLTWWP